jgi:hypothetical protein
MMPRRGLPIHLRNSKANSIASAQAGGRYNDKESGGTPGLAK